MMKTIALMILSAAATASQVATNLQSAGSVETTNDGNQGPEPSLEVTSGELAAYDGYPADLMLKA